MPSYKLYYFHVRARAELTRLVFKTAGVAFEDVRLTNVFLASMSGQKLDPADAEWPGEWKAKMPFGQLPVLAVDGKMIAQSVAIARYAAREFGLAGKSNWEQARADMIVDEFEDIFTEMRKFMLEKDAAKKTEMTGTFYKETVPRHFGYLENLLKENNGGKGFFVGDSLTYADLALANAYDVLGGTDAPFASFPLLAGLVKRVRATPKVADWIKTRPQTPF